MAHRTREQIIDEMVYAIQCVAHHSDFHDRIIWPEGWYKIEFNKYD